jgi:hypothetical protein
MTRARICERLRSPGIDFKESIPPAYVVWRAGTLTLFVVSTRQATKAAECLQIGGLTMDPTAERSVFTPYVRFLDSFRVLVKYGVLKSDLIIKKTETEFANISGALESIPLCWASISGLLKKFTTLR